MCTHEVTMHKNVKDPHGDMNMWEWLKDMVTAYGADGMSSDDSDIEKGEEVYYSMQLPW